MLKIKFNINEFTIIFWEELKGNKCWKILCSSPLFLSASAPHLFSFFLFQPFSFFQLQHRCSFPPFVSAFSTTLLEKFSLLLLFLFSSRVPFFSVQKLFFFSPKCFALLSLASFFSSFFSPYVFKGQPKTCCSPKISLQPKHVALLSWSQMACLKTKRDLLFMPILKPKNIYIPSASIYPKPNILSSCFVSFIWINLHFLQICNKI